MCNVSYKVEVLLSVMNKNNKNKIIEHLKEHNINTDTIVINQDKFNDILKCEYNKNIIRIFSLAEKGIGLSRNTALERANGDILLFADDDEFFISDYKDKVIEAFLKLKQADIILFNVKSLNQNRPAAYIKKISKVHWFNCMRYGTYQIVVRANSIRKKRLVFSTLFGGGSVYGSGEDSIFLMDALNAGCKIYTHPYEIAFVKQETSTWFNGYDEKYFYDRGALYAAIFKFPWILGLIQILRKKHVFNSSLAIWQQWCSFCRGIESFNNLR